MTILRWEEVNFFHKWHKSHRVGDLDAFLTPGAPQPCAARQGFILASVSSNGPIRRAGLRRYLSFNKQRGRNFQKAPNRLHKLRPMHAIDHPVVER